MFCSSRFYNLKGDSNPFQDELIAGSGVIPGVGPRHFGDGKDDLMMGNGLREFGGKPSRPLFRPSRLAARTESAGLAAEMQEFFGAAARAPDAGEAVHEIPAIEVPVHHTIRHTAQRAAGVLETFFIGADNGL